MLSSLLLSKHRLKYLLSWALKTYALFLFILVYLKVVYSYSSKKLNSERKIWIKEDASYIRKIFTKQKQRFMNYLLKYF